MKNSNKSRVVNAFIVVIAIAVGLVVFMFLFASKVKLNKDINVLKRVDISTCPSLSGALLSELRVIADKNGCSYEGVLRLRIGPSWKIMYKKGKASKEEMDAVVEFDDAMEKLKDSMEKIGSIPSLRKKIKI